MTNCQYQQPLHDMETCGYPATHACEGCGIEICDMHTFRCDACHSPRCPDCLDRNDWDDYVCDWCSGR